jgi:hypothetical protein
MGFTSTLQFQAIIFHRVIPHDGAVHRHAAPASNGMSSWTVTPFGVLEATAMCPSS